MTKERVGFYGGKFFPLHKGHLDLMIKASCMVDKLYVIMFHDEKAERDLCKDAKIKYEDLLPRKRMAWISKALKDIENVVIKEISKGYGSWEEEAIGVKEIIGKNPDVIFSSEPTYDNIFKKLYPGVEHVVFDRSIIPISATKIRLEGAYKHWDYLPKPVQESFVKKVAIIGTESSGKSTLTRNLAKAYNTEYVDEYGRTICEEFNGCDGILPDEIYPTIAYGHKMKEYELTKRANKVLFIDSEAVITQFYSELYNGITQPVLDEIAKTQNYDLYIFLEPDVKWVDDGLRVHGSDKQREENNNKLKDMFDKRGIEYICINGDYFNRFNESCKLVDKLIR